MEVLIDYHLVFIVMSFALLVLSLLLLFVDNTKEHTFGAMIICGINYLLCMFNSFAFFSIGIIGYKPDGTIEVSSYADMYPAFSFFMLLLFINVGLLFYAYWLWVRNPWELDKPGSSAMTDAQLKGQTRM